MVLNEIQKLPKVELHCHLDGSLPVETVRALAGDDGICKEQLCVSGECRSLKEYLEKFDLPLKYLQRREQLEKAAEDLVLALKEDGVIYGEIRFAPMLSVAEGLSPGEVVDSVLTGLKRGEKKTGIRTQAILCAMRNHTEEQNEAVLCGALERLGDGVCAIDLAGDEAAYPNRNFQWLFQKAKKSSIPFTIHSGECGSVENIREAVQWKAGRIGHGIALMQDEALTAKIIDAGIGVEMCPTSNLQTKAVKNMEEYPFWRFLEKGVKVSVNTDNRTVSDTTLSRELERLLKVYVPGTLPPKEREAMERRLLTTVMRNAVETAFAGEDVKERLLREVCRYDE